MFNLPFYFILDLQNITLCALLLIYTNLKIIIFQYWAKENLLILNTYVILKIKSQFK